jgi:hypothetical protein
LNLTGKTNGRAKLTVAAKRRVKTIKIATVRGTVQGISTGKLRVKLTKKGLALLKRKHKLAVKVRGTVTASGGGVAHVSTKLTLKLKR